MKDQMAGPDSRARLAPVVHGLVWLALVLLMSSPDTLADVFEQREVVTGVTGRQTILSGFIRGRATADLVVIHEGETGERRVRLLSLDPGTRVQFDASLGGDVRFVDVMKLAGRDRLIVSGEASLGWFDPDSSKVSPLVAGTTIFEPQRLGIIPHVDVSHDLNGDRLDDLVLPQADGFQVFVQSANGTFAAPVTAGPGVQLAGIYGADGYRHNPFSQGRIHLADFDQDGRQDLVYWNGTQLSVHYQQVGGVFASAPVAYDAGGVRFDSDDRFSLATGAMTGRVLAALADLNGDGVADMVVFALTGASNLDKRSVHEVYFGSVAPAGGTTFGPVPDASLHNPHRVHFDLVVRDFDGDGFGDLMLSGIRHRYLTGSLWKRLKGYMGDDIWLDLDFYRTSGGVIPDTAGITRRIQLHNTRSIREPGWVPLEVVLRGATHQTRSGGKRDGCRKGDERCSPHQGAFNAPRLIGDVTGDGRDDLLIGTTPHGLEVFAGVAGNTLFDENPQPVQVSLPDDGEYVWLADINGDKRDDVLVHHVAEVGPDKVLVLIAR